MKQTLKWFLQNTSDKIKQAEVLQKVPHKSVFYRHNSNGYFVAHI